MQVLLIRLQFLIFLAESFIVHFEQFDLISVLVEYVLIFIIFLDYLCVVQIFEENIVLLEHLLTLVQRPAVIEI